MQKPSDELIEIFLQSLCTKEEAAKVLEYLEQHPEHPYLLKEWEDTDGTTPLPENYTQQMFDGVDAAIVKPERKTLRLFWKLAVAASIAGIVISVWLMEKKADTKPVSAAITTAQIDVWTTKYNTRQADMLVTLADSSVISISPHASVRYRNDFNIYSKREIYMTGRVFFRVAKNKQKPFIVYSEHLSTTALGTAFCVNAPENGNTLSVQLFEGKVVVAITDTAYHYPANDYYLMPGQELLFDANTRSGLVQSFSKKTSISKASKARIFRQEQNPGESYMFNNQTLAEVLDELSEMYHVDIRYSKASIGNIYFIGKVDRGDSVDKIIHDIALLNKLSVTKQHEVYILQKKH